ncbi:MAG TPA: hypothetical protein VIC85_08100 [Ktedonobacterales bacterium]
MDRLAHEDEVHERQVPAGLQHADHLARHALAVGARIHVMEHEIRDDDVAGRVVEGQLAGVAMAHVDAVGHAFY